MKVELGLSQDQIDRLFALTDMLPACRFLGNNVPLNGRYVSDALSPLVSRGSLKLPTMEIIQIQKDASKLFCDVCLDDSTKQKLTDKLTTIHNELNQIESELSKL